MINQEEGQQFQERLAKNFSQTKQKNSWQSHSQKISESANILGKAEIQCEERNMDGSAQEALSKIDWTQDEENILIQKHRQIGNKWASISQYLNGKNDNCVKNHFYSKLRKMIRKLNRIVQIYFKKSFKTIPNATIYKLVEASEERFKQKPICIYQVSMASQDVISKMLKISAEDDLQSDDNPQVEKQKLEQYKELIEQINRANKNYKKKSKKIKNSTIKAPIRTKKSSKSKKAQIQFDEDYSADESQNQSEKELHMTQKHDKSKPKFQLDIGHDEEYKQEKVQILKENKVQIKQGDQMQELLKNIGLLHEGKRLPKEHDQKSQHGNHSIRSFSDFQNPSECLSFFDDSNNCWKKQSRMFVRMNKRLFGGSSSEIQGL